MANAVEALSASRRRVRVMDAQIVTKVPKRVKELVNELAVSNDLYEADIVRRALAEYFEKRGITQ